MAKRPTIERKSRAHKSDPTLKELSGLAEALSDKPVPATYKASRGTQLQTAKWAGTIFGRIEAKEKGVYIVSGLPLNVSETDFEAFSLGVAQILYNQSHQSGNLDTNSGLIRQEARGLTAETGHTYYSGTIVTSLNDLCRKSYGVEEPTTQQKEAMMSLIDTLHDTPVRIDYPNGDRAELSLSVKMGKFTRAKDGAISYWLALNPIFCESVKNNFAEYPQDLTKRLTAATTKKTAAHYRLLKYLGSQMQAESPCVRRATSLIEDLGMEAEYRKNKSRAEKRLLSICKDMIKIGIISDFEEEYETKRGRKSLSKVRFHLNPSFPRKLKGQPQDTQQTEP